MAFRLRFQRIKMHMKTRKKVTTGGPKPCQKMTVVTQGGLFRFKKICKGIHRLLNFRTVWRLMRVGFGLEEIAEISTLFVAHFLSYRFAAVLGIPAIVVHA